MKYLRLAVLFLFGAMAVALAPSAQATAINGVAYCNISWADATYTPAPGAAVSGTQCATFQVSTLDFEKDYTNTIGSFLTSNGSTIGDVTYLNGFDASSNLDNSFYQFWGTAFFVEGQTYSATHDDGIVMVVDGVTVINSPNATAPITNTFVFQGSTGAYDFVYDYTQAEGGSEFRSDAAVAVTPEPRSLLLCGTGMLFLLSARRRLRKGSASTQPLSMSTQAMA